MDRVLEDVRRRNSASAKIHPAAPSFWGQGLRRAGVPAPVQQLRVHVQPCDVLGLWRLQYLHTILRQPGYQVSETHIHRPSVHGARSLRALPDDGVPDAVADTSADDCADDCADSGANVSTDIEPNKRAKSSTDAKPNARTHAFTDATAATAAHPLRAERLRPLDTVLEDVRRRGTVPRSVHRDGASVWWPRMRRSDFPAPVQQLCVHVQPCDVFKLWCLQRVHGFVRQQGYQVSDAHVQRQVVHGSEAV